jgi:hypothetical protein
MMNLAMIPATKPMMIVQIIPMGLFPYGISNLLAVRSEQWVARQFVP